MKDLKLKIIIFTVIFFTMMNGVVFARTSEEIGKDIADQQKKLEQEKKDLDNSKKNLDYYNNAIESTEAGIPGVENEIKQVEAELEYNQKRLDVLAQYQEIKKLEKEKREAERQESLKSSYMDWRLQGATFAKVLSTQAEYDLKKNEQYSNIIINNQQKNIMGLTSELIGIAGDLDGYNTLKFDLETKTAELEKKKEDLQNAINYYNSAINSTANNISNLQNGIVDAQNNISLLSQQQKAAFEEEAALAQQAGTGGISIGGCRTADDGNNDNLIEFCGVGNDFVQGHGVGMSQWGANGMGKKGYAAADIVRFYYTGVQVAGGYEGRTINVTGYGSKNIEDYVAGQGEVPSRACGTQDQVNANPSKYALDNGSGWSCWPEEAIKAQAIAFRTYALHYVTYKSSTICATSACQVYNGGTSSRWAADETRGQVLTYGGNLIEALYSADNNQGFGTANNDTVFQGYSGNGTVTPYLRAVNDNTLATHTTYTNWGYRSKVYSMDDIYTMMNYFIGQGGDFGSYLAGVRTALGGKPTKISFERDPSFRVKKVNFQGASGGTGVIGAWWFTYMYNVYNSRNNVRTPEGNQDWLWSQTFFVHVK